MYCFYNIFKCVKQVFNNKENRIILCTIKLLPLPALTETKEHNKSFTSVDINWT